MRRPAFEAYMNGMKQTNWCAAAPYLDCIGDFTLAMTMLAMSCAVKAPNVHCNTTGSVKISLKDMGVHGAAIANKSSRRRRYPDER